MLSNMESNNQAELNEVDRLAAKAASEATAFPVGASIFLTVAELLLIGAFVALGWSTALIVGWLVFFATFHLVLHLRRRARPRKPWTAPRSRHYFLWSIGATVVVNAIWIPLFFLARPVAVALLVAALMASLISNVATLRHQHA